MNTQRFQKKAGLLHDASPLEFLPNLSRKLGPMIYVKRDDQGGRGGGGNKLRKFERIIADALESNCDTLIIAGHYQSNAARQLVGAACQLGLKSIVVCKELIPPQNQTFNKTGNALLMSLMNARLVGIEQDADYMLEMDKESAKVRKEGGRPYIIPFGGSNVLGALGYVDCVDEIIAQFKSMNMDPPDYIISATGSGGTQAGLIAGLTMKGAKTKVQGFSVLHPGPAISAIVSNLVSGLFGELKIGDQPVSEILIDDKFKGKGYGIPTREGIDAIKLMAESEGLFLCPVYTGKAMSGLIDYIKSGKIKTTDRVVFIHTGGAPLVHAYYDCYF